MKREILFKAKRKDNGEWYFGSLIKTESVLDSSRYYYYIEDEYGDRFEVIPETVCQYTCIKDVNDVKIFENDVVKYEDEDVSYVVIFNNDGYWSLKGKGPRENEMLYYEDIFHFLEVIGNIFDEEVK